MSPYDLFNALKDNSTERSQVVTRTMPSRFLEVFMGLQAPKTKPGTSDLDHWKKNYRKAQPNRLHPSALTIRNCSTC